MTLSFNKFYTFYIKTILKELKGLVFNIESYIHEH